MYRATGSKLFFKLKYRRRNLIAACLTVVLIYLCLALSPLRERLGRTNPSAASLLSPPLLNFHGTYKSGEILGIRIGITRDELVDVLQSAFGRDVVRANCAGSYTPPFWIPVVGDTIVYGDDRKIVIENARPAFATAMTADVICIDSMSAPQVIAIYFENDRVGKVEIDYVRVSE